MRLKASTQDPLWYKDAIIYETHVKAFFDSNNDGIGDFQGLVQKLDYLQDLGVTCLWLLPFFPSPLRDDGYDISDYCSVHPSYGTLDDFKAFIAAAHERKLQVLIELVINHTSDEHSWFQRARKAPLGSPERDFYVWSDSDQKYRDARIIFTDTEKSNWAWDSEAKAYYWHRFFSHQPDLNFDNPAVIEEVIKAMRFWLTLGVDGMRLDAIPYLVERDGTNCENLPETHQVIKRIRRDLDAEFGNRMMLAEANQWPMDVREYFGDSDECHMAFHFPLMPRMFMAVRLEDRHPITEIMAQTPEIPEACQWGLFLRNHDELTLEMVTDEERDYMYFAYSADPRMRINVGIRRRLAPLMENNLRRIELMNSILFSFPGTPIIYYGDEIGMGDNIYLGDRNGVRTPMQWAADRNAGFSRANPARIYSPVVIDPVYGYEAVNVEAQQSDSSSLLHWMRNMIALRKLFRVFSRGKLEFLSPANRKVLAYIRSHEEHRILCVANLSRFAQPVELDLSCLAGMTPVEMLGYTEFPQITAAPYRLSLGPYGFMWFELQGVPAPMDVRAAEAAEEEQFSLVVKHGWEELLEGRQKEILETKILPRFIPAQRWFGGKARRIEAIKVKDWVWLVEGTSTTVLALVVVEYEEGGAELYFVPMGITAGREAEELQKANPAAVLCKVSDGRRTGVLHDALASDAACQALLRAIERKREFRTRFGMARAFPTEALVEVRGEETSQLAVVRGSGEQSNTSIFFGDRLFLKLFRQLESGPNPDLEITRFLNEKTTFKHAPRLTGGIEYVEHGTEISTLAILQQLIPNQGDGWSSTLEELGRYYERSVSFRSAMRESGADGRSLVELSSSDLPPAAHEIIGLYLESAATLGRRTGEMHLALASSSSDSAFAPEPVTAEYLSAFSFSFREHGAHVFEALKAALGTMAEETVDKAAEVLSARRRLLEGVRHLERADATATLIRIHGDYHLGQVLWVENDYVIVDFEGEPARPLAERRAKQPALKDVAGMLRSFSYAAYAGLLSYTARRAEEYDRLEPWATFWERWTAAAFLRAYRQAVSGSAVVPEDNDRFRRLLDVLLLDKALYELHYELNNRPTWVRIPLRGILSLAGQR